MSSATDLPPIRDRLQALGLLTLPPGCPPDLWLPPLREWARTLAGGYARRAAECEAVVKLLGDAGLRAPAKAVKAALQDVRESAPTLESDAEAGTVGDSIVDIVRTGDGLAWLTADGGKATVVPDVDRRPPWRPSSIPWPTIPDVQTVKAALAAGAEAPLTELADFINARVVLPEPAIVWATVLAAWSLGTYHLDAFTYFPILLLEGPPERGKTRLGKAVVWPAFRGLFTPTPTAATLFRDRSRHRVTLMLDVEDLEGRLARSDLMDLVLAGFERDGVVRRCTRPDADPEDQIETFAAYGASILTSNRPIKPQSPLASRCIRIPLPEAGTVRVPPAATPADAIQLRAKATAWAAAQRAMGDPLPYVTEIPFTGRMRDLSTPLLRVLKAASPEHLHAVIELLSAVERHRRSEAAESWEARVAIALWEGREDVSAGRVFIRDLLPHVNRGRDESEHLTAQQVGVARKNLGLRSNRGGGSGRTYVIWPGDAQAEALHDRYTASEDRLEPSGCSGSSEQPSGARTYGAEHPQHPFGVFSAVSQHDANTSEQAEQAEHSETACADPLADGGLATDRQVARLRDLLGELVARRGELPSTSAWVERRITKGLTEADAYDLIGRLGAQVARSAGGQ